MIRTTCALLCLWFAQYTIGRMEAATSVPKFFAPLKIQAAAPIDPVVERIASSSDIHEAMALARPFADDLPDNGAFFRAVAKR